MAVERWVWTNENSHIFLRRDQCLTHVRIGEVARIQISTSEWFTNCICVSPSASEICLQMSSTCGLTLSRPLSHLCDGRSHSFRDHGPHICDENKGFNSDSRNFFVLSPLVLRVVSFESVYSALSDDVWYCSGWYWKFCEILIWSHVTQKCVRSAWPECIDSVARCGSSITCASMELARCGSSSTCARYGATIFPVCLAFQGRKISLILSSFSFWRKNHTNQR